MEKWIEVFRNKIPRDVMYQVNLRNGEEQGLVVELDGKEHKVILDFGWVFAIRMLDEGIIQSDLYSKEELLKYRGEKFKNVIYQITGGEFNSQIKKISDGYWTVLESCQVKHYLIVTENFSIDIIAECEPKLTIVD